MLIAPPQLCSKQGRFATNSERAILSNRKDSAFRISESYHTAQAICAPLFRCPFVFAPRHQHRSLPYITQLLGVISRRIVKLFLRKQLLSIAVLIGRFLPSKRIKIDRIGGAGERPLSSSCRRSLSTFATTGALASRRERKKSLARQERK
ncbi:MAG: hypothetical protein JO061_01785 [Acidobacteriaceae bacterium]|nr:hypothetical protein [Acidobacteriaceae bacterium]